MVYPPELENFRIFGQPQLATLLSPAMGCGVRPLERIERLSLLARSRRFVPNGLAALWRLDSRSLHQRLQRFRRRPGSERGLDRRGRCTGFGSHVYIGGWLILLKTCNARLPPTHRTSCSPRVLAYDLRARNAPLQIQRLLTETVPFVVSVWGSCDLARN